MLDRPQQFPSQFFGQPALIAGVAAGSHPYKDISGGQSTGEDSPLKVAIERMATMVGNILSLTAVVPSYQALNTPAIWEELFATMLARLGAGARFFVTDSEGTFLQQGYTKSSKDYGFLEFVGTPAELVGAGMALRRQGRLDLHDEHLRFLPEIVDAKPGSIVIETGVGRYSERVVALHKHVTERSAHLLCHDVVPHTARKLAAELAGRGIVVPCVSVPSDAQFFGGVFRKSASPVIITMQDVVSSMSADSVTQFAESVRLINAEKVVITQSTQIPLESNLFSGKISLGARLKEVLRGAVEGALAKDSQLRGDDKITAIPIALVQAFHTLDLALNALLMRYMLKELKERAGLIFSNAYMASTHRDLSAEMALSLLGKFHADFLQVFVRGQVNTVQSGVSGLTFSFDPSLPQGILRVKDIQLHIEINREKIARRYAAHGSVEVLPLMTPWAFGPASFRLLSESQAASAMRPFSNNERLTVTPEVFAIGRSCGAKIAISTVLGVFGVGEKLPWITPFLNDERRNATLQRMFITGDLE